MKKLFLLSTLIVVALASSIAQGETGKVYSVWSGELIFSWANMESKGISDARLKGEREIVKDNMRFTLFFHLGQYYHYNINENVGIISGWAIRNIGSSTDENIITEDGGDPRAHKIIRRTYSLGVPLAIKVGSFKDHFFMFAGGEVEWSFWYKYKYWEAHSRNGGPRKKSTWWPSETPTFLPSVFGGLQFPGGIQVKYKYYPGDFLNHSYRSNDPIEDLSNYTTSPLHYVSLCWQFMPSYRPTNNSGKDIVAWAK